MAPGCDLFVNCVYTDLTQLLATTDAGAATALPQAIADCSGDAGPGIPASSAGLGTTLIQCIAGSCASSCVP
jgi:hypothetical protein